MPTPQTADTKSAMTRSTPVGTVGTLTVHLPLCPSVELEAKVARCFPGGLGLAFSVAAQERFVPYLFGNRFGERVTSWLSRPDIPPRLSSNVYVIGCPVRFATSQLVSLVAPCGTVETASLIRLPEGSIATILMASPSEARAAHEGFHQQSVAGATLFVFLPGTQTGEILRLVLQQNALQRFGRT
jgi:hypothetical protein